MKNLTIKHTAALIAFMCFVSVLCVAPQAAFAQPTADAPIDFAMRTDVVGGAPMYYIDVATVHDQAYQSVNITYPASLYINYPASLSSVWDISSSTGVETITASFILKTGTRSAGELKADLESVFFTLADHAAFPSAGSRITIQASASRVTTFQDADGFLHYYTFVPCTTVNWFEAYNLAKTTYMQDPRYPDDPSRRLQGYLATITSGAEQAKIYGDIAKECGWLGGTRMLMRHDGAPILDPPSLSPGAVFDETYITNAIDDPNTTETQYWYWANGPEAGNIFYLKPKLAGDGAGTPDSGTETANNVPSGFNGWEYFSFWKEHEPNNNVINEPPGEYVLQFAFEGSERWNDYNHANLQDVYGYYVEFGGYLGDPKASEFIKLLSPCSAELITPTATPSAPPTKPVTTPDTPRHPHIPPHYPSTDSGARWHRVLTPMPSAVPVYSAPQPDRTPPLTIPKTGDTNYAPSRILAAIALLALIVLCVALLLRRRRR